MDPYLESPVLGTDFHVGFAAEICKQLSPRLRPAYVVRMKPQDVEEQLDMNEMNALFSGYSLNRLPSRVPFRQTAIEIRDVRSGLLVTAIELLSPVNKRPGSEGRAAYLRKRDTLLASTVHLLEIDLLRRGDRLPRGPAPAPTDYYIVLSRSDDRPDVDIWPVSVRAPLPAVARPPPYTRSRCRARPECRAANRLR